MQAPSPTLRPMRLLCAAMLLVSAYSAPLLAQTHDPASRAEASIQVPEQEQAPTAAAVDSPNLDPHPATVDYGHRSEIGLSTHQLFALQRSAQGARPRHIDGEQASRSYQRYLKSFETAIPEQFETGMNLKKQ